MAFAAHRAIWCGSMAGAQALVGSLMATVATAQPAEPAPLSESETTRSSSEMVVIALVIEGEPAFAARIRAELGASGIVLAPAGTLEADGLRAIVSQHADRTVVVLERDGVLVGRDDIEPDDASNVGVHAVVVAEVIRAAIESALASPPEAPDPLPPLSFEPLPDPVLPDQPLAMPSRDKENAAHGPSKHDHMHDDPAHDDEGPQDRWSLGAAPGIGLSPGGFNPTLNVAVAAAFRPASIVWLELLGVFPTAAADAVFEGSAVGAKGRFGVVALNARVALRDDQRIFEPRFAAGLGMIYGAIEGIGDQERFITKTESVSVPFVHVRSGFWVAAQPHVRIGADLLTGLATSAIEVRLFERTATWGQPFIFGALGAEVAF